VENISLAFFFFSFFLSFFYGAGAGTLGPMHGGQALYTVGDKVSGSPFSRQNS
jgi:hypothetical protein